MCNLASIALPRFVVEKVDGVTTPRDGGRKIQGSLRHKERSFDHAKLVEVVRQATYNLNRIIDVNFYPVEEAERSNMRHRPIGLGVQGLADVFLLLVRAPLPPPPEQALRSSPATSARPRLASSAARGFLPPPVNRADVSPSSPSPNPPKSHRACRSTRPRLRS